DSVVRLRSTVILMRIGFDRRHWRGEVERVSMDRQLSDDTSRSRVWREHFVAGSGGIENCDEHGRRNENSLSHNCCTSVACPPAKRKCVSRHRIARLSAALGYRHGIKIVFL